MNEIVPVVDEEIPVHVHLEEEKSHPMGMPVRFNLSTPSGWQKVRCTLRLVDPALAARWLRCEHPNNRDSNPGTVQRYAEEMRNGRWESTPEPIVFNSDGLMINGGHRCRAIVASGSTVLLCVWENWPESAFHVFDRHKSRSVEQGNAIDGLVLPKAVYAMARTLIELVEGETAPTDSLVTETAIYLDNIWSIIGEKLMSVRFNGKKKLRAGMLLAFCLAYRLNPTKTWSFLQQLAQFSAHQLTEQNTHPAVCNFMQWLENYGSSPGGTVAMIEAAQAGAAAMLQFCRAPEGERPTRLRPSKASWHWLWEQMEGCDDLNFLPSRHSRLK